MKRTEIHIVDDLTGERGASPYRFGSDGYLYEIDMTPENIAKLRELLAPYASAARRIGRIHGHRGGGGPVAGARISNATTSAPASIAETPEGRREIRKWWRANHRKLALGTPNERGRIPREVVAQYEDHVVKPMALRAAAA